MSPKFLLLKKIPDRYQNKISFQSLYFAETIETRKFNLFPIIIKYMIRTHYGYSGMYGINADFRSKFTTAAAANNCFC